MNRRGLLIILSSPSGAGKSFHSKRLRKWDPSIRFSVSATTRPPRVGETDGADYHFVTKPAFLDMVSDGEMLEHAEVFTNFYGSPKAPVKAAMGDGADTLFDIDWQGGQQIRNSSLGNDVVSIFLLPPSMKVLEERLRSRGQDSDEVIANRMAKSLDEVSHWAEYDYVLVNDDPDECAQNLKAILTAERARRERQVSLNDFVRKLQSEYEGTPLMLYDADPADAMLYALNGDAPDVHKGAWVAPHSHLVGKVTVADKASVWFCTTIRGDNERITIGAGSNVQENCVLHTDMGFPLVIGENCTIGHKAMLHGCIVGDNSLIGMGATVLNGAVIGKNCLIGAGALITEGTHIPDGSLVMGMPGKVVRQLDAAGIQSLTASALHYQENAARYRKGLKEISK